MIVIDSLGSGGAQNQATILAVELKKRGYDVAIFTYFENSFFKSRLEKESIPVIHFTKQGRFGMNVILNLIRTIKERKIDVAISFLNTPNFYLAVSKYFVKNFKAIISYRSKTDFDSISIWRKRIDVFSNNCADLIVTNSYHEKDNWASRYPALKNKLFTIYNAVYPSTTASNRTRSNNLLSVGSVSPLKNGKIVIEALNILVNDYKIDTTLHWVGRHNSGLAGSRQYFSEMNELISKYKLNSNWNWVGQQDNLQEYYIMTDALIHASTTEGLPNVVGEAQMEACPVVISNILDHPRLIRNGVDGFLFDPTDSRDLTMKIKAIYDLPDSDYQNMCYESKEQALKLYSINTFTNSFIELIETNKINTSHN